MSKFLYQSGSEFRSSVNQKTKDDGEWAFGELSKQRVMDILNFFMNDNDNVVCGFAMFPDGADGIIQVRLANIFVYDNNFCSLFSYISSLTITPVQESVVVEMRLPNLFRFMSDDEIDGMLFE
ncbi:MAG: hypothetical protein NC131_16035 [Roseburia sp.]|nr:hypothetical protein [Roseburia sp.]